MFIQEEDYKAVVDAQTLSVIHQADDNNRERALKYAMEEISSYLRSRYNMNAAFSALGEERNQQLVMITVDVSLYHLIAWLPKRIGFEIREIRYKRAIEWLESVQSGKASPALPSLTDDSGNEIGTPIKYGSMKPNKYDY